MGFLFDERAFINENAILHESRIVSQYSRFLDKSPTYVTYYNVSNIESTADLGFLNIEKLLGDTSPLRFNKINNLPMYGIEEIIPDLNLDEEGMNVSFDGDAILLPNTVKPKPNDFFTIQYLDKSIIFMVTRPEPDTIRSNGYFKVSYTLKYLNSDKLKDLDRQTVDEFDCFTENIGTEEKVLMRSADVGIIKQLNDITTKIADYYKILFFDTRYNSFLFPVPNSKLRLYDRVLTEFITRNKLFAGRKGYETIHLTREDESYNLQMEYHHSLFRAIEQNRRDLIQDEYYYMRGYVNNITSAFYHWSDSSIRTTMLNVGNELYIRPELLDLFKNAHLYYREMESPINEPTPEKGMVNISIPVGNNEVFTTDAGYGSKVTDTPKEPARPVVEEPVSNDYKFKVDRDATEALSMEDLLSYEEDTQREVTRLSETIEVPEIKKDYVPTGEKVVESDSDVWVVEVEEVKGPEYKPFVRIPEGENIMTQSITMYLSGNAPTLHALELEELLNYVEYMSPNHETFILTPVLLFVLEQYFISYMKNS